MIETLTTAGVAWAMRYADTSITAKIALLTYTGGAQDWPESHRSAAVHMANLRGEEASA